MKDTRPNRFTDTVDYKNQKRSFFILKSKNIKDYEKAIDKLQPQFEKGNLRLVDYDGKNLLLVLSGGTNAKRYLKGLPSGVEVTAVERDNESQNEQ